MDLTVRAFARPVGALLLATGIAVGIFALWIVGRIVSLGDRSPVVGVFLAGSAIVIGASCIQAGYRLSFNRPNKHGSLFSPFVWRMHTAFFLVIGIAIATEAISAGKHFLLLAPVVLEFLGYQCFIAGRAAAARRLPSSLVFPPETSLVGMDGFAPAGFRAGIEILNDEHTKMQFVVDRLAEDVGLSKIDAVRTMLEIHTKGGVLLPMPSLAEAARVADAVMSAARKDNQPLTCRAVSAPETALR